MKKGKLANKRLRKGDLVRAVSGNEKGRTGEILTRKGDQFLVKGFKVRKKAVKPSEENGRRNFIEIEGYIHASRICLCVDDLGVKLRTRFNEKGQKEYYYLDKEGKDSIYRLAKEGNEKCQN